MAGYFKHCHNTSVAEWGVLPLPRTQSVASAVKNYSPGEWVFLACTKTKAGPIAGKIFAACTLVTLDEEETSVLINPVVPRHTYARWPRCVPIHKAWRLPAFAYDRIAGGSLMVDATSRKGRIFTLTSEQLGPLERWLSTVNPTPIEVYHSPEVQAHLDHA